MADTSRFTPQGIYIEGLLSVARPVNALVTNGGSLYRSTNATVATYVLVGSGGGSGDFIVPDSDFIQFGTGDDVRMTANGTNVVIEAGAGAGLALWEAGVFRVADTTDNTKALAFNVAGITAATTRTWTAPDANVSFLLIPGNLSTADPGDAAAIPVTQSTAIDLTIGAGAETNTLAIPTAVGQRISIIAGVVGGGTRAITAASAINQAGNTIMTFGAVNDWIVLQGVSSNGTLQWRVASNDGVALS